MLNCKLCSWEIQTDDINMFAECPICGKLSLNQDAKITNIEVLQHNLRVLCTVNLDMQTILFDMSGETSETIVLWAIIKLLEMYVPTHPEYEQLLVLSTKLTKGYDVDIREYILLLFKQLFEGFTTDEVNKLVPHIFKDYETVCDIENWAEPSNEYFNVLWNLRCELKYEGDYTNGVEQEYKAYCSSVYIRWLTYILAIIAGCGLVLLLCSALSARFSERQKVAIFVLTLGTYCVSIISAEKLASSYKTKECVTNILKKRMAYTVKPLAIMNIIKSRKDIEL